MLLWTFQPASILEKIETNGYYCADPLKSELLYPKDEPTGEISFIRAYDYMKDHMVTYGYPIVSPAITPIWAWYLIDGKNKKPDLRTIMFRKMSEQCGEPIVLLHLDIPDELVCLSDFDDWHNVLNNCYCITNDELCELCYCVQRVSEDGYSYYDCDHVDKYFDIKWETTEDDKKASWEKIFMSKYFHNYVQACFWRLDKTYIKQIDYV